MKSKKVPMRLCVGCGTMQPKKDLIRVLKNAEGEIKLDFTGKQSGRGLALSQNVGKIGKLAMGLEPTKDAMYRGTVSGVLVASDASAKTRKEAAFYCGQAQVPCLELAFTKADFAQMIGRGSGVLAICDDGFFRKMQLLAEQEKQEPRGEA